MPSLDPAVLKYYLFKGASSQGFVIPILVVYMLSQGISYTELGVVEAAFMVGFVFWEIPTGYVGDRIGRRQSILIGNTLVTVTFLGFTLAQGFLAFLALYSLWSFSITFQSGSADAWLYEILEDRLDEAEFARVRGRGRSIKLIVTAIASVLGAYIYTYNNYYPFLISAVLSGVSVLILYTFPASPSFEREDDEQFTIVDAAPLIKEKFLQSRLRTFILYTTLFFAFREVVQTFMQPVSLEAGLTVSGLGWLYAGLNLFGAALSYFAGDIHERIGIRTWFYTAPFVVTIVFASLAFFPLLAIPAFFLLSGVMDISGSLRNQYINDRLENVGRATALSAVTMVWGLVAAGSRVVGGVVAEAIGPVQMLAAFAIAFIIIGMGMVVFTSPVEANGGRRSQADAKLDES